MVPNLSLSSVNRWVSMVDGNVDLLTIVPVR